MPTRVRSYSKINLGLAIGPPRPDGFHGLVTLYQTLALHDLVTVEAERADDSSIVLEANDARVPLDGRNTMWKMVEAVLAAAGVAARVRIGLDKRLPVQGGMGAGSANAAAALLGLERELGLELGWPQRLELAARVGSDVPLFLLGGSVLGRDRGQVVQAAPAVTLGGSSEICCVVALPGIGVSTPLAFREWDRRFANSALAAEVGLHSGQNPDTVEKLSRIFTSVFPDVGGPQGLEMEMGKMADRGIGAGLINCEAAPGITPDPASVASESKLIQSLPEKPQENPHAQSHACLEPEGFGGRGDTGQSDHDLLRRLVESGIANDFETVVFSQYPLLGEIQRCLQGSDKAGYTAVYAALSGSGSALFGLYGSAGEAAKAQQALRRQGTRALATTTIARPRYWGDMFAE